jgi:hypothetical protein
LSSHTSKLAQKYRNNVLDRIDNTCYPKSLKRRILISLSAF